MLFGMLLYSFSGFGVHFVACLAYRKGVYIVREYFVYLSCPIVIKFVAYCSLIHSFGSEQIVAYNSLFLNLLEDE